MKRASLFLFLGLVVPPAVAAAQTPSGRQLHPAARVRVKVPKIGSGWLEGTVVEAQTSAGCLAIRLEHADAAGRRQYAFLAGVTALRVDRRTNQGVATVGLPPATESDWEEWTTEDIARAAATCRRRSP